MISKFIEGFKFMGQQNENHTHPLGNKVLVHLR